MEFIFNNPQYLWLLIGVFIIIITHYLSFGWNKKRAFKF